MEHRTEERDPMLKTSVLHNTTPKHWCMQH